MFGRTTRRCKVRVDSRNAYKNERQENTLRNDGKTEPNHLITMVEMVQEKGRTPSRTE